MGTGTGRALRAVTLDDKYTLNQGRVLISGNQALVRLLLLRRELDRKAGLNTAGYVSGYRGSPLGGLDLALWAAKARLDDANIVFQPGVNEDLAATAVWGTQQLKQIADPNVDGVFALWYAKGPGVDRAGDPIKHGNYSGTHAHGGVLAVFGDDHPGKSSTIAHHSEQMMAGHSIPVFYPSGVSEFIQYGLLGYELSRYSGCWVGMKVVNETIEQTSTIDFDVDAFKVAKPDRADLMPPEGVNYRGGYSPLLDESILMRAKLPLVQRFVRANGIDRVTLGSAAITTSSNANSAGAPAARFGIVTAGKSYQDTMQALRYLGIDDARARALGVALYKVGLIWPLEPLGITDFARGKDELFFVEEKAAFLEPQAAAVLYNLEKRPRIIGKTDEKGQQLLPPENLLEPVEVALAIAGRLRANGLWDAGLEERLSATQSYRRALLAVAASATRRLPYFCSGCPHNTSTNVPAGSQAISGIGCHGMAIWAKPGTTIVGTQMGGEGMNWVGAFRFTKTKHMFQNLGDGTYFHSGLLAIRAAVASGANITYKILFNDAVAMTGGQPIDGPISVGQIAHQVQAEGVKKVVLVSVDPSKFDANSGLPAGIQIYHRDELDRVQREIREVPGCTVLIYEQTCAAEKRRRRKRGAFPDPEKRMFIHDSVCEGCGDCSVQSGCVSIEPRETTLGRKRRINQSNCNKDYSCVKGFCPSFVTVYGGQPKKPQAVSVAGDLFAELGDTPVAPLQHDGYGIMIAGIGGTGVITVGAVLAMAAHLEGHAASAYDMTGLSQKNGAVYSHLRVAARQDDLCSQRLGLGEAALVLGFDMVSALSDESYRTIAGERSRFLANDRVQPTASLNFNPDDKIDTGLLQRKVREKLAADRVAYVDATGVAVALCGDAIATNLFMVGVAAQRGWLPVSNAAIERAIELNGIQIELNRRAFAFGRLWAHNPERVRGLLGATMPAPQAAVEQTLEEIVAERRALLTQYQDAAYAQRYAALVDAVRAAEQRVRPDSHALATAVARHAAKLMAYKDEYEVARLYSDPAFLAKLKAEFDGELRLAFNLAPPLFAKRDAQTGHLQKGEYGGWMLKAMGLLARLRFLRGGAFDLFGRTDERRKERALVEEYERTIRELLPKLNARNLEAAVTLAEVPEKIRGFGHVKELSMTQAASARSQALAVFERADKVVPIAVAQKAA